MDDDHRELVRRLFAAATALIETAHDAAIAGQSGAIAAGDYAEAAHRPAGGGAGHRRPGQGGHGHRRPSQRWRPGRPEIVLVKGLEFASRASMDWW